MGQQSVVTFLALLVCSSHAGGGGGGGGGETDVFPVYILAHSIGIMCDGGFDPEEVSLFPPTPALV